MLMTEPREDWSRLASYVVSARLSAGYRDRKVFSEVTGITHRTLGKLENGQRVSPETLAEVERAVGWKPDSARTILHGGEPSATAPPEGAEVLTPEEISILETYRQAIRDGRARQEADRGHASGHGRNGTAG